MLVADVNVFVYAHRAESPRASEHRDWLTAVVNGEEPSGVSELVLSAFVRIVSHHRIHREPTPPVIVLDFCRAVLEAPAVASVRPGSRHWSIFDRLCRTVGARGLRWRPPLT